METKKPMKSRSKKIKPVYKPYLKGNPVSALCAKRGLKLMGYALIFLVLNIFVGTVFNVTGSAFLRIVLNGALLGVYAMLLYLDGLKMGDSDVAFAEIQYAHQQSGETISKADKDHCFHPLKGFFTVFFGLLPILLVCLAYALFAKKNTYSLQALPSWLSAFSAQEEITAPLAYYNRSVPFTVVDGLRIFVRLLLYPFYNLVGMRNADAVLTIDRLSPVLAILPFLFYGVGYIFGLRSRAMTHGGIAHARRRRKKGGGINFKKKTAPRKTNQKELV